MEISDQLQCLFSAQIEEQNGSYVVEVPDQEIQLGEIQTDETYRVALLSSPSTGTADESVTEAQTQRSESQTERSPQTPPVEEGEHRDVEIEDIGDQGDGITRVERGFVVIVPDTEPGERVTIEIADVRENVAFGEVVERLSYDD
jgi:predicted RNA-binding protein with TRAM domain